ncbi:MAG TPA: hypothetical protein VFZ38_04745 [Vicinamibacterales bacterium]
MLIVFALCGAYAVYCLATNPAGAITTPDSFHYLNMTPIVPLGYPLFLKLTGARAAIIVQPIIFSAALAFLGREIVRATRSTGLAASIVFGSMIVPQIRGYHASILSESLFLTLLVIFLALAVRFLHQPTWRLMIVVAIAVGVAATVRRTGFAFVPVMLVMALLQRSSGARYAQLFLAALAPFAVIAATEQVLAPIIHDGAASSLLGRHMFAKAALIDASKADPGNPAEDKAEDPVLRALDDQLEHAFAPVRRMLAEAPGNVRGVLTIYYETCLQGGCADQARAATGEPNEARQTEVMGAAGIARIRRAPLNFLQLTWRHYSSLWTYDRLRHPQTAADLNAFLATHRPLPYEELAMSLGPDRSLEFSGSQNVRYAQYGLFAIALITGTLAVLGGVAAISSVRLPPAFGVACVAALTLHGGLILTALLAAGFTRFLLGLWPAAVTALAFGGFATAKLKIKN